MLNRFGWFWCTKCFILCDFGAQGAEGLVLCAVGWLGELKREEPSHAEGLATGVHTQMYHMISLPILQLCSHRKSYIKECSSVQGGG